MDKYNGWLSKVPKHRLLMFHFQWRTTWVLPNYLPNSAETVVNFTITKETLICEECCSFSIGCRKPRLQRLYNLKRTGRVGKKKQRDGQKIEMRRLMSSWAAGVGAAEKVVVFWTGADSLRLSALPRRRRGTRGGWGGAGSRGERLRRSRSFCLKLVLRVHPEPQVRMWAARSIKHIKAGPLSQLRLLLV